MPSARWSASWPWARELVVEPRLPYTRLPHDRHELPVPALCLFQSTNELRHLRIASDKAREPPCGRCLETRSRRPGAHPLVDLHRIGEALHGYRPERLDVDVAFDQLQRGRAEEDAAGGFASG